MKTICIIPARGGSKRIPRKNIKDFLGKPIIAYSIEAALQSKLADSGCENRAKSFMEAISDCESISQVKKIWDAFPKDEADALTQEIEKKISSAFQIERMYGSSNDSVEKLKESIVSLQ
jgi:hypothetical protein